MTTPTSNARSRSARLSERIQRTRRHRQWVANSSSATPSDNGSSLNIKSISAKENAVRNCEVKNIAQTTSPNILLPPSSESFKVTSPPKEPSLHMKHRDSERSINDDFSSIGMTLLSENETDMVKEEIKPPSSPLREIKVPNESNAVVAWPDESSESDESNAPDTTPTTYNWNRVEKKGFRHPHVGESSQRIRNNSTDNKSQFSQQINSNSLIETSPEVPNKWQNKFPDNIGMNSIEVIRQSSTSPFQKKPKPQGTKNTSFQEEQREPGKLAPWQKEMKSMKEKTVSVDNVSGVKKLRQDGAQQNKSEFAKHSMNFLRRSKTQTSAKSQSPAVKDKTNPSLHSQLTATSLWKKQAPSESSTIFREEAQSEEKKEFNSQFDERTQSSFGRVEKTDNVTTTGMIKSSIGAAIIETPKVMSVASLRASFGSNPVPPPLPVTPTGRYTSAVVTNIGSNRKEDNQDSSLYSLRSNIERSRGSSPALPSSSRWNRSSAMKPFSHGGSSPNSKNTKAEIRENFETPVKSPASISSTKSLAEFAADSVMITDYSQLSARTQEDFLDDDQSMISGTAQSTTPSRAELPTEFQNIGESQTSEKKDVDCKRDEFFSAKNNFHTKKMNDIYGDRKRNDFNSKPSPFSDRSSARNRSHQSGKFFLETHVREIGNKFETIKDNEIGNTSTLFGSPETFCAEGGVNEEDKIRTPSVVDHTQAIQDGNSRVNNVVNPPRSNHRKFTLDRSKHGRNNTPEISNNILRSSRSIGLEDQSMESNAGNSPAVFGSPETFGAAGGDAEMQAPKVADRAQAIQQWNGGRSTRLSVNTSPRQNNIEAVGDATSRSPGVVGRAQAHQDWNGGKGSRPTSDFPLRYNQTSRNSFNNMVDRTHMAPVQIKSSNKNNRVKALKKNNHDPDNITSAKKQGSTQSASCVLKKVGPQDQVFTVNEEQGWTIRDPNSDMMRDHSGSQEFQFDNAISKDDIILSHQMTENENKGYYPDSNDPFFDPSTPQKYVQTTDLHPEDVFDMFWTEDSNASNIDESIEFSNENSDFFSDSFVTTDTVQSSFRVVSIKPPRKSPATRRRRKGEAS